MKAMARVLLLTCVLLVGCRAARDVAVTSYHVATAPVRLVHRAIAADSTPPPRNPPAKSKGSPPRGTAAQPQFPTAEPVPGRPGLVFNPYDRNGGYIDVSGYAPGSKVKDPDSQKIFIVP